MGGWPAPSVVQIRLTWGEPLQRRDDELRTVGFIPQAMEEQGFSKGEMTDLNLFLKDAEYRLEWRKRRDRENVRLSK